MAERLTTLVKRIGVVLGERRRLARTERQLITALNTALRKIGYEVVAAGKRATGMHPRRRGRRIAGRRRARRRTGTRRTRGRAKKG